MTKEVKALFLLCLHLNCFCKIMTFYNFSGNFRFDLPRTNFTEVGHIVYIMYVCLPVCLDRSMNGLMD